MLLSENNHQANFVIVYIPIREFQSVSFLTKVMYFEFSCHGSTKTVNAYTMTIRDDAFPCP